MSKYNGSKYYLGPWHPALCNFVNWMIQTYFLVFHNYERLSSVRMHVCMRLTLNFYWAWARCWWGKFCPASCCAHVGQVAVMNVTGVGGGGGSAVSSVHVKPTTDILPIVTPVIWVGSERQACVSMVYTHYIHHRDSRRLRFVVLWVLIKFINQV